MTWIVSVPRAGGLRPASLPANHTSDHTSVQPTPEQLRNIHVLLLLVIAFRMLASGLLSSQTIFRGEQCTTGAFARANDGGRGAAGGGRHRQAVGGAGGVLHPRAGHRPPTVPVWPRGVPRAVVRRRRRLPRAAGRSIADRVPGHVRRPRPHHGRAARPPPWPHRRARLRCGPAADQERLHPLRPR
jgi:hypothetical protein